MSNISQSLLFKSVDRQLREVAKAKDKEVKPLSNKDKFHDMREQELETEIYNDYKSFLNRERNK